MLELILAKYLFGYVLQSVTFVLGIYAINKKRIEFKPFVIVTAIFSVATFILRWLVETKKINFGVHTLLSIIIIIFLGVIILKTTIYDTTLAAVIISISIIFFSEAVTALWVGIALGFENIKVFFEDPLNLALSIIPTGIMFFIIVLLIYRHRTKKINGDGENGKISR